MIVIICTLIDACIIFYCCKPIEKLETENLQCALSENALKSSFIVKSQVKQYEKSFIKPEFSAQ